MKEYIRYPFFSVTFFFHITLNITPKVQTSHPTKIPTFNQKSSTSPTSYSKPKHHIASHNLPAFKRNSTTKSLQTPPSTSHQPHFPSPAMGLIKTAIMTGGGIYAANKLAKTTERHYEQRPSNNSQQQYGPNYPPQGYWGPPLPGQPQDGVAHWYPAPTNNSTSRALPIENERSPEI
ncbi:hypothetical protein ABVK25_000708 [Lepraria finkii]|uniref:Uncharacterized protein n=1 Tax=Lepraria finkii TaxID=1340010 RepID=A0ABR4BNW7_9LECA